MLSVRAEVGSRLSAIDHATTARESEDIDLQPLLSDLRDVDYATRSASSTRNTPACRPPRLPTRKISQLSLFDYL